MSILLSVAMLCLSKIGSSEQILSHFGLKTKSQNEFIIFAENQNYMTLIKSISGIRGTIGGAVEENLTPIDAVKFAAAYGTWLKQQRIKENYRELSLAEMLVFLAK